MTTKVNEPIMLSHYADSHFGFCIEYEINFIDDGIPKFDGGNEESSLFSVEYCEHRFDATANLIEVINFVNNIHDKNKIIDLSNIFKILDCFKYKDKKWEYEKEYRIAYSPVKVDYKNKDRVLAEFPEIKGVYFGERSNNLVDKDKIYHRDNLKWICKDRKIPTYIIKKHEREYKMEVEPLKLSI